MKFRRMKMRNSGILLHITSLPGDDGVGTMGKEAYKFIDFLEETGQQLWQILPLGPAGSGNSPYQCFSAFAGNPLLINLELLVDEGFLMANEIENKPRYLKRKVEFERVRTWKNGLFMKAFNRFQKEKIPQYHNEYNHFLNEHGWWLHDYALFMAAKEYFGPTSWHEWDDDFKFRKEEAVNNVKKLLAKELDYQCFLQFLFFKQWFSLKRYANLKGVQIVGDVPLYVSGESVDVWANTDIFLLDKNLEPIEVGGVPPDYFSETGQLWGNPVFDWKRLKARNYDWWMARLHFNLNFFNRIRIDHFRGLESYWSIPAKEETAMNGKWVPAFGKEMLAMLKSQIGEMPLIAEDLGIITTEVDALRDDFGLPGMKVLQFAFTTDETNKNLPHNYTVDFIVYTGTHDNNTTLGWLQALKGEEKTLVGKYIGSFDLDGLNKLMEMAMASVAKTAIIPMQDILELDGKSRMNTPGVANGNWGWRFQWSQLKLKQRRKLKELTVLYNRSTENNS